MKYDFSIQKDWRDLWVFRSTIAHELAQKALAVWNANITYATDREKKKLREDLHSSRVLYEDISHAIDALEKHHSDSHHICENELERYVNKLENEEKRFEDWLEIELAKLPIHLAPLLRVLFKEVRSINNRLLKPPIKNAV
jgi:predicted kinase